MKAIAVTVVWYFLTFLVFYLPLSFAALSFNPVHWTHMERFAFAMLLWAGIVGGLVKTLLPKQKLTI